MKWPWTRRVADEPKSILESLDSDRPDLNVSLWLQRAFLGNKPTTIHVRNAYFCDRFVSGVNGDGLLCLISNDGEDISEMVLALDAIGLPDLAQSLKQEIKRLPEGIAFSDIAEYEDLDWDMFADFDEQIIQRSAEIEKATHTYIRSHIEDFHF